MTPLDLDRLDFTKGAGVVTVVAQDAATGAVLMVAQADREALERTLATGEMHYRSRTRGLWRKGATSGNTQRVVALLPDCDGDAVLARVAPAGPACHTGAATCFGGAALGDVLDRIDAVIRSRQEAKAATGYTGRLLADRNLRLKKLGEEAAELAVACADSDPDVVASEAADLLYHLLVASRAAGVSLARLREVLVAREGVGGS